MNVFLSELQRKEVISIVTGLNYGHVVDIEIDNMGNIISFIVENKRLFRKNLETGEKRFGYREIEKIGKDVILIKV